MLTTKPDDLSLIPETHMVPEKTDSCLSTNLHMLNMAYTHMHIYMYIHMHICIYMHIQKNKC